MRLWVLMAFCAALAGAVMWQTLCSSAHAQSSPPVTIDSNGNVSGVPAVSPETLPGLIASTFRTARDLARSGAWGPFVALLLTVLASLFSLSLKLVPSLWEKLRPHMGYVVIGLTLAMTLSGNLAALQVGAGALEWASVIGRAVLLGMAACGGWELVLKPLLARFAPGLAASLAGGAPKP